MKSGTIVFTIKVLILVLAFFYGRRIGQIRGSLETDQLCTLKQTALNLQWETEQREILENSGCDMNNAIGENRAPVCEDFSTRSPWPLHLVEATVPKDVFSFLHHPGSPAKWSWFLSDAGNWFDKAKRPHKKVKKVLDSSCQEIYLTRTGSRASQPNKCVAVVVVPDGRQSMVQLSHRKGFTARNTDQYQKDYPREYDKRKNDETVLLYPFLSELEKLVLQFKQLMGEPLDPETGERRKTIVMVANEGVMDLLLNFLCSAEGASIDLASVVVFVGDDKYIQLVQSMGVKAIYSESLGSMPKHAAKGYLDNTFSRMMWFKTTSVYVALSAGFEVLFQDVDLVWLRDPFLYFENKPGDILFMDDGARTPRYTPFFVNSGFYFVKHNDRTKYMFETMMKGSASEIEQTHSHQSVLIRHIAEAHHLFGLKIFVLDTTLFPSGQAYHENKKLIKKIQKREFRPFVFHMCWTDNRENKVVYFKDVGLWYLPDEARKRGPKVCTNPREMNRYVLQTSKDNSLSEQRLRDHCCVRDLYWPPEEEKKKDDDGQTEYAGENNEIEYPDGEEEETENEN